MAKTVRKRGSGTQLQFSPTHDPNDMPQIQQFQDLIDLQKSEFETIRSGYTQQNVQLAKSNSSLMIKVREMDKSVSELIQENVLLRSKLSMKDLQFKEKLTCHIQIMEKGVLQRFEEILHMFASIRRREGLEPPPENLMERSSLFSEPKSILKRNRASSGSKTPRGSTIAFNETENQVISPQAHPRLENTSTRAEQVVSPPSKKRRKSSRRESLFHPSDFEFSDDEENTNPGPDMAATTLDSPQLPSEHIIPNDNVEPEATGLGTESHQELIEESCNLTNSLIDYSIPEEMPEEEPENISADTSGKVSVYHDNRDLLNTKRIRHPTDLVSERSPGNHGPANDSQHPSFIQNPTSSQKKVKHSMKSRGGPKKMIDEVMPTTCGTTNELSDSSRSRRTRGRAINYALPSLRAKMRRPTEKLVDATTVTNIRDLQVRTGRRKSGSKSRDGTPLYNESSVQDSTPQPNDAIPGLDHTEPKATAPFSHENSKEAAILEIARDPPTTIEPASVPKPNPLKDITNKAPAKSSNKTKKLFKKPIVGDLGDENSCSLDESSGSHSASFRVNEDDLSVFDLLDDLKTNKAPKTHRARAGQAAEKRGRKTAFRL
ncbi:LAQU0S20e00540g1_1 [Lachancea quebecensis]|uniref:LAQU0S20e00540g1_1 n=1 Tax=Lachancea quebecensis TaxID=1654605 RepID=A0A0P1L4P0_9SACH|nr:LAQU0S20e00540g1_1 [Lachancea quebecensis]